MKFQNNFIEKFPSKHENVLIFYADEYFYELGKANNKKIAILNDSFMV